MTLKNNDANEGGHCKTEPIYQTSVDLIMHWVFWNVYTLTIKNSNGEDQENCLMIITNWKTILKNPDEIHIMPKDWILKTVPANFLIFVVIMKEQSSNVWGWFTVSIYQESTPFVDREWKISSEKKETKRKQVEKALDKSNYVKTLDGTNYEHTYVCDEIVMTDNSLDPDFQPELLTEATPAKK